MSYLRIAEENLPLAGLGCGPGCPCASCRSTRLGFGERYIKAEVDREPLRPPAASPSAGPSAPSEAEQTAGWLGEPALPPDRPCPAAASTTTIRCKTPQACPPIPTRICIWGVDGVPFEYVEEVRRDPVTRLFVITRRQASREQRFIPAVRAALSQFLQNCTRFGMPVEAILTLGSHYCRCISNTNRLSNHSFADAIDVAGVRWRQPAGPTSRLRETIVHNFFDPEQRGLLRRLDACLRLSFPVVIDYHRADHRDHFHCDLALGAGQRQRNPRGATTLKFVQEMLGELLRRSLPITGRLDAATKQALRAFAQLPPEATLDDVRLNQVMDRLFTVVASGVTAQIMATAEVGRRAMETVRRAIPSF